MGFFRLAKLVDARISSIAKENGITGTPVAQAGGRGGLFKVAKAAGVAKKMNGDTSAPAQKQRHGLSARNNGVRRNNMFGN